MTSNDQTRRGLGALLPTLSTVALDGVLATLVVLWVVATSFYRLRFGVDVYDESFYAVLAQRFLLGDRPYIDEYNLRQTGSLFTLPFYWTYLQVVGSNEGIIYFLRLLYFALQGAVAWSVYRFASSLTRWPFALLVSALPISFMPFCVPTCSYNTFGYSFFAIGCFTGLRSLLLQPLPRQTSVVAGIAHGLACVAYPPLVIPVIGFAAATRLHTRRLWGYAAGVAGVGVVVGAALAPSIARGLPDALAYEAMFTRPRGWTKLASILGSVVRVAPGEWLAFASLGVIAWLCRRYPVLRKVLLPALLPLVIWWFSEVRPEFDHLVLRHALSLQATVSLGLLCGFFLLFATSGPVRRTLFYGGFLPSLLAGVTIAFASDQTGSMNAGLGLFVAAALGLVALGTAAPGRAAAFFTTALVATVPLGFVEAGYSTIYGARGIEEQTTEMTSGPFKGLFTEARTAGRLAELSAVLAEFTSPGERLLVYYGYPAAYLLSTTRPALPTSWSDRRARYEGMLDYYREHRTGKGTAVVIKVGDGISPALESLVEDPARLIRNGGWYRLYREPPP